MKQEKQITPNELARMISKSFDANKKDIGVLRTELHKEVGGLRNEMNERFDKIEKVVLADHRRRIEQLEADMRILKSALAI